MIFGKAAFTVGQLRGVIEGLQDFSLVAGAKTAAQDLRIFSDMLKPFADRSVVEFCADMKSRLQAAADKPKGRKKATSVKPRAGMNDAIVRQYVDELRSAGTDRLCFDDVFDRLTADKSLKAGDVGEIARQYASGVTKYKSIAAAHADISKAFVRQARFENKIR